VSFNDAIDNTVEARAGGKDITPAIWNNTINRLRKQILLACNSGTLLEATFAILLDNPEISDYFNFENLQEAYEKLQEVIGDSEAAITTINDAFAIVEEDLATYTNVVAAINSALDAAAAATAAVAPLGELVANKVVPPVPNVFNKATITVGQYYNATGVLTADNDLVSSALIPITQGDVIRAYNPNAANRRWLLFNANGTYAAGLTTQNAWTVNSASYKFLRITLNKTLGEEQEMMVTINGAMPAAYVGYGEYSLNKLRITANNLIDDSSLSGDGIKDDTIPWEKLKSSTISISGEVLADASIAPTKLSDMAYPSDANLYDKSSVNLESVYWYGNSSWRTNEWLNNFYSWNPAKLLVTSAPIPVVNGDVVRTYNTSVAFGVITVHNAAGVELAKKTPAGLTTEYTIANATAAYILVLCDNALGSVDSLMVTVNAPLPSAYTAFGAYYLNKLVIPNGNASAGSRWYGKTMAIFGDSISQLTGVYHTPATVWNTLVAQALGMTVLNYAIAGACVSKSTPASAYTPIIDVYPTASDDADLVVVFGGTNDWNLANCPFGTITDADNTTFCGTINLLCEGLLTKYVGKTICFILPIKRKKTNGNIDSTNTLGKTLRDYCDAIETICGRKSIPVFDAWKNSGLTPFNAANCTANFGDLSIHPNAAGHIILANAIQGFLSIL